MDLDSKAQAFRYPENNDGVPSFNDIDTIDLDGIFNSYNIICQFLMFTEDVLAEAGLDTRQRYI
ncbi:hypothetical protein [Reichenbachiella sp. MALMAid0571]|uniref:hypothetical protein n=1 Tax=Reichenbachiella sp. MALMAid0571 TaxID=3143939 RepID=UPI0032E01C6E